ncbi:hypothetical protein ACFFX1_55565 [Dactylosporangium sucinum]|uniref:Uncharacterized protein n=1 Tax=Dactylosporangium sucinum TaxID=1424081 RepID=A0A917U3C5_9ACTN|nr:hypothetical protein [Dactylosporangium sucinum]GGM52452.1 hypothetical protein GCM10007977_062510 [Dactylosporangium sucinum]
MTNTTTAPLSIPAEGLRHEAGDLVATVIPTPQAGYRIQVRVGGDFNADLSSGHTFEVQALRAWAALIAQFPAAPVDPAPAASAVRLGPAAKGTQTKVSDPGHTALAVAELTGSVARGGHAGQASIKVLTALAKRGYLQLTYQAGRRDARKVVTGGVLTNAGRIRLAQLTTDEREAAEHAARLATALSITTAAA